MSISHHLYVGTKSERDMLVAVFVPVSGPTQQDMLPMLRDSSLLAQHAWYAPVEILPKMRPGDLAHVVGDQTNPVGIEPLGVNTDPTVRHLCCRLAVVWEAQTAYDFGDVDVPDAAVDYILYPAALLLRTISSAEEKRRVVKLIITKLLDIL